MIVMNEDPLGEGRIRKGRKSHQGATQKEDIKLMLVNGYLVPTPTTTPREVITLTLNILKMKVLPVFHLCNPTPMPHLTHQMKELERCFLAKGPKVSHLEYVDFNSDEDDLLGDDDLLVDNSSDKNYDELAINHDNQDKMNNDDKKEIERLTKELNTLKLVMKLPWKIIENF